MSAPTKQRARPREEALAQLGSAFAAHHDLGHFMVIVDENGYQAMGSTKEVLNLGSVEEKFASFGSKGIPPC